MRISPPITWSGPWLNPNSVSHGFALCTPRLGLDARHLSPPVSQFLRIAGNEHLLKQPLPGGNTPQSHETFVTASKDQVSRRLVGRIYASTAPIPPQPGVLTNRGLKCGDDVTLSSMFSLTSLGLRSTVDPPFKIASGEIGNVKENGVVTGGPVAHGCMGNKGR